MKFILNSTLTENDLNIVVYNKDNETLENPFSVSFEIKKVADNSVIVEKTVAETNGVGLFYAPITLDATIFNYGEYYCTFYIKEQEELEEFIFDNVYFEIIQNDENIKEEENNEIEFKYITVEEIRKFSINTLYQETIGLTSDEELIKYIKFSENLFNNLHFTLPKKITYPEFTTRQTILKYYFDNAGDIDFNILLKQAIFENVVYLINNYERITNRINLSEENIKDIATNGLNETYGNINATLLYLGTNSYTLLQDYLPLNATEVYFV